MAEGVKMSVSINHQTYYMIAEACAIAGTNRNTLLRWIREGRFPDVKTFQASFRKVPIVAIEKPLVDRRHVELAHNAVPDVRQERILELLEPLEVTGAGKADGGTVIAVAPGDIIAVFEPQHTWVIAILKMAEL